MTFNLTEVPSLPDKCFGQSLSSLDVSIDMVWEKLCKLNPSMSSGPDGYHLHVFREVKEGFIFTISEISGYWSVTKTMEGCYSNTYFQEGL